MKRTTVMLTDETLVKLRHEARRRGASVAEVVRSAVERDLADAETGDRRRLGFIAIGEGDEDGAERVDEHVSAALRRHH